MSPPTSDPAQLEPLVPLSRGAGGAPPTETGAFFYGTLMHPQILRRVLQNDGAHLRICPAILFGHTRFHIQYADYPAVIPSETARKVAGTKLTLTADDEAVRGVLVQGLTVRDVKLLDLFEGDEYTRSQVSVLPLSPFATLATANTDIILSKSEPLPPPSTLGLLPAATYLWAAPVKQLLPSIWSYDVFVREKLSKWVDTPSRGNDWQPWEEGEKEKEKALNETDRRRDMAGVIVAQTGGEGVLTQGAKDPNHSVPTNGGAGGPIDIAFGHNMLKYFAFRKGYINLNNGSYGSPPLAVLEWCEKMNRRAEERPDQFHRFAYQPMLNSGREKVAKLLNVDVSDCVILPNVTHAINTVLHNFEWQEGDILVGFSTTYFAVEKTLRYFTERVPGPALSLIELTFPASHEEILQIFRNHLRGLPKSSSPGRKVVVVLDSIVSNPGVLLPWEAMVKICHEENAFSIVDGAHGIGLMEIDLKRSDPSCWSSNCHKWLMTKRGCAVLYVARRHQHLIRTAFPTSWGYVSPPETTSIANLFEWTGTIDLIPFLSINAALEFRESIGGEKKIREYCYSLARRGGQRMAEVLGTEVMESSNQELTTTMVNVRLPLIPAFGKSVTEQWAIVIEMMRVLVDEYDCMAAIYIHDHKLWVRASAQIWNEVSDFEYLARSLRTICDKPAKL